MNNENLRIRKVKTEVKGSVIEYEEYYKVDESGVEVFDRDIEILNDERLYNIYKKQNNLLTNHEIKNIRKKYNLTQKDYALIMGVGEVTVHRFEKGAIQTEAVDAIMKLSNDPDNMYFLLLQNRKNISDELFNKLINKIKELKELKRHALVDINDFEENVLTFEEERAIDIARNIVKIYNDRMDEIAKEYGLVPEYITNNKLQELLYYVQALCLMIFKERAFSDKILITNYGPIVENLNDIVDTDIPVKEVSNGMYKVLDAVIEKYGKMEVNNLIEFTHEEEPCKNTKINDEIDIEKIKNYFEKVYS